MFRNMLSALLALVSLAAAQPGVSTSTVQAPALRLLAESEYPDFNETFPSKKDLVKAANKGLAYLEKEYKGPKIVRIADRDYGVGALQDTLTEIIKVAKTSTTPEAFNALIRERFDVFLSTGIDGTGRTVFSSYYQPLLYASRKKGAPYLYPLYKRPADMISVDLAAFGAKTNGVETLTGRVDKDKRLVPYFTRDQIDSHKALSGKALEIAWLRDRFDVLDVHIQGSGILRFPDGKEMLAKFAATNAHPYNSVGQMLIKAGTFTKEEINRDKIRRYFKDHPEGADWILSNNPRFTFFDLVALPADGEPFGSTNQSLVPSRSVACDPAVMPLGSTLFFTTPSPQADKDGKVLGKFPTSRFAVCLDTGGAIKGPGRIDIYVGHGKQATAMAPLQWDDGKLYLLLKKVPPRER